MKNNDCLKEKLMKFSVGEDLREELSRKDTPMVFREIAQTVLSGYFKVTKGNDENDMVKIYPTCVELYFHEEQEDGIKDYIVYHRNIGKKLKSVFPLGILHNHVSGIDVTFEQGDDAEHAIRLSVLVREFRVDVSNKKTDIYQNDDWDNKNYIVKYPTHLYDAIYSQYSIFDGGFKIEWNDGEETLKLKAESEYRINVPNYIKLGNKMIKEPYASGKKEVKTKTGDYVQDTRKWLFRIDDYEKKNNR